MKKTVLLTLFLVLSLHLFAQVEVKISIRMENQPIKSILKELEKKTDYTFIYSSSLINVDQRITLIAENEPFESVVQKICNQTNLVYSIEGKRILLNKKTAQPSANTGQQVTTTAQTIRLAGVVTDASTGEPVSQTTVRLKESTTVATFTDNDGKYAFSVPTNSTLIFSIIGYKTVEIPVNGRANIDVALTVDNTFLDDVVIVAYGSAKKESITGSVSSVTSRSIENRTISSVGGVLEGQAAGVIVNNAVGSPGNGVTVRIRGFSTYTGNNSPLYVVDGIPFGGNTADLNPQDIESMTILKDAASSALYGSRASNGVVMITTKKGKSDKASIRVSASQGIFGRGIPEYDRLGPDDFMEVMWRGMRNYLMTNNPTWSQEQANQQTTKTLMPTYLRYNLYNKPDDQLFDANGKLVAQLRPQYTDLDWLKHVYRNGHRQEYTVSGDAASEKSSYYFSAGYLNEQGYITHSSFQRFSGLANISVTPVKWFHLSFRINGSSQVFEDSDTDNTNMDNPIYYTRNMSPIYPVYLHNLETGDFILDAAGNKQYDRGNNDPSRIRPQFLNRHVVWSRLLDERKTFRNTLASQISAEIKFLKDFAFVIRGDVSHRNAEGRTYNNAVIGAGEANNGRMDVDAYRYRTYSFAQQLTWRKNFGRHEADALVGHENFEEGYSYQRGYAYSEIFAANPVPSNFTTPVTVSGASYMSRIESYLARVRYNFDNKYFLEASVRRDGSSRFYKDNRWGTFYSLGGSWSIHREPFMAAVKNIDALKLRASYGQVGNDNSVGRYGWMGLYGVSPYANLGAAYKTQNEALSIKWESLASIDIGFEGRAFDRLNFVVDYFDKRSIDLLFDVFNPLSAGATSTTSMVSTQTKNLGTVSNAGVELTLDVDVIRNSQFKWNIGFTGAYLRNKIITLPEQNRQEGIIDGSQKLVEGRSLYSYWTYQFAGVDQMTGNSLYLIDYDRFYVGTNPQAAAEGKTQIPNQWVVTIGDKHYTRYTTYGLRDWAGSAIPKYYGSISTSLTWKNFDFSVLCTYSLGGKLRSSQYQSLMEATANPTALHQNILKSWNGVPAGMTENDPNRIDPNGIPVVDWQRSTYTNSMSTRWIQSSAYFVVKNVNLTYRIPKNICTKLNFQDLRVMLSTDNLLSLTAMRGINPQQSTSGGQSAQFVPYRIASVGITCRF